MNLKIQLIGWVLVVHTIKRNVEHSGGRKDRIKRDMAASKWFKDPIQEELG